MLECAILPRRVHFGKGAGPVMSKLQLSLHPLLASESVLAILAPSQIDALPLVKSTMGAVFPNLSVVCPRDLAHLGDVVKRSAKTHAIVLTVGGDGTFNRVLNAADLERQALGLVPGGSGNDLARTLGFPRRLQQAIARLHALSLRPTDYGVVNGIRYHNSAGFGLDSATLRLRMRGGLPKRNYTLAFLMALAALRCPAAELTYDGASLSGRFFWVLAMNGQFIGGGTRIAPQAALDDGLLDMVLVKQTGKLNLLLHLPQALKGAHLHLSMVEAGSVARLACSLAEPIDYLAIDGELYPCGGRDVVIEVRPGGMRMLR